jgi:site-specific DNA-methyltransferase (adenine-specific)
VQEKKKVLKVTMQSNLFGEIAIPGLTIKQASKDTNVSTATIRNWIKTGYLEVSSKGIITKNSLDSFISNIAGKEKLNSRANKLLKDSHNHQNVSDKTASLVQRFSGEKIGIEYENSLSNSYRNKEGIYYTPSWV